MEQGALAGILIGLARLNCSQLRLKRLCHRQGLLGLGKVLSFAVTEWLRDIRCHQLPGLLGGVAPVHAVLRLCECPRRPRLFPLCPQHPPNRPQLRRVTGAVVARSAVSPLWPGAGLAVVACHRRVLACHRRVLACHWRVTGVSWCDPSVSWWTGDSGDMSPACPGVLLVCPRRVLACPGVAGVGVSPACSAVFWGWGGGRGDPRRPPPDTVPVRRAGAAGPAGAAAAAAAGGSPWGGDAGGDAGGDTGGHRPGGRLRLRRHRPRHPPAARPPGGDPPPPENTRDPPRDPKTALGPLPGTPKLSWDPQTAPGQTAPGPPPGPPNCPGTNCPGTPPGTPKLSWDPQTAPGPPQNHQNFPGTPKLPWD
uniref:Autophagy-related protein 2 n=1 Tax=Accipiter nisus TaxID=211598 RepID=A0A8B9N0P1_9AVES